MAHAAVRQAVSLVRKVFGRAVEEEDVLDALFADVDGAEEEVDTLRKVGERDMAVGPVRSVGPLRLRRRAAETHP